MNEVLTASAGQEDDVAPGRVARGKPVTFKDGVPVYDSGRAPAFLRTKTQLVRVRRKPAVGQRPVAYIYTRWYRDRVALWDPEQAAKMRPLSALQVPVAMAPGRGRRRAAGTPARGSAERRVAVRLPTRCGSRAGATPGRRGRHGPGRRGRRPYAGCRPSPPAARS
ncbi:hypothetical protein GCM10010094_93550 [Streptomyces flaveus]|uniref:Uncharacterized protein n=1 Tax=Streptomyces flaveus TaxID=66370 RepID=A0A917RPP1_9ACTN|nr:hypothetical protein GCM10010094_93550 [Streptomyces flaveus]